MKTTILAAALLASTALPAIANEADSYSQVQAGAMGKVYEDDFGVVGMLMRAGYACNNRHLIAFGVKIAAGKQHRAPSDMLRMMDAFPELTKQWMQEGALAFNSHVGEVGLTAACQDVSQSASGQ